MNIEFPNNFYSDSATVYKVQDKTTPSGHRIATITVFLYEGKDKQGNYKPSTIIDVRCWNELAEYAVQLQPKHRISILGKLTSEHWLDKNTQEKRSRLFINASHVEYMEDLRNR